MRRLNLVLLATLQLCGARSRGFNVYEDLLTFPQFEVNFSDKWISEKDAHALLEQNTSKPSSADLSNVQTGEDGSSMRESRDETLKSYKLMSMSSHQYLCSIPIVHTPGPDNQTATELAKAEEAKELARATTHGWKLLSELGDHCLYFMSGWWSYKFCNNREIVQFHAAAAAAPNQPPKKDPKTLEYVLGSVPSIPTTSLQRARKDTDSKVIPAELQVKGDQRYLVQRLDGGTICDLTGRARTIEVQYHCVPGLKKDRIAWIKEVTICAYLMVINTPRLCEDVAFLPPQETKANIIDCQLVLDEHSDPPLLGQEGKKTGEKAVEVEAMENVGEMQEVDENQVPLRMSPTKRPLIVGGVVVGARNVLSTGDEPGKPPLKLNAPREYFKNGRISQTETTVELVAQGAGKAAGGKVEVISKEEMETLDIDPEVIEEMRIELEKMAGDSGWRLEVVELPGGDIRELRGYVDDDGEGEADGETHGQGHARKGSKGKQGDSKRGKKGAQKGSEDRFKDEL